MELFHNITKICDSLYKWFIDFDTWRYIVPRWDVM